MIRHNCSQKCHGFSMIELMVAMLIGLLLTAAVLQTFVSLKRTYEFQEEFSRIQENGRFAIERLSRDIRMAGFFGCFSKDFTIGEVENELNDQSNVAWDLNPLKGDDNVSGSYSTYNNVVAGTDVIAIQTLSDSATELVSPYSDSAQMFVDPAFNDDCSGGSTTCHEGEILMVTDCSQGTIFQVTQTTETGSPPNDRVNVVHSAAGSYTPGNNSPATFNKSYGEGSFIARFTSLAYYIRENDAGQPSLYRSRLTVTSGSAAATPEELVEGVENMQILYGEDTDSDGSPNYYVPASAVANMENVVSVHISLLLRSIRDNLTEARQSLDYNGSTYTPSSTTDRRIRKVFSTKIALRNRLG